MGREGAVSGEWICSGNAASLATGGSRRPGKISNSHDTHLCALKQEKYNRRFVGYCAAELFLLLFCHQLRQLGTSYLSLPSDTPWNIPQVTCLFLVYTQYCIFSHVRENMVSNIISAACTMGRQDVMLSSRQQLSCALIGCIFGVVV